MLGMHGTFYANYAVDGADLLIALGVRFDDRVTGKIEAFATRSRIIHIGEWYVSYGCCALLQGWSTLTKSISPPVTVPTATTVILGSDSRATSGPQIAVEVAHWSQGRDCEAAWVTPATVTHD